MKIFFLSFFIFYSFAIQAQELGTIEKIDSLITDTRKYVSEHSFEKARRSIESAEYLSKDSLPVQYACCLYNHGRTHLYAKQYAKAIPFYKLALEIQEKELGHENADYAYTLTGLANALRELGQYEKALPLYVESKEIRKKVMGLGDPSYAGAVNNLGILYWEMGDFEKSEIALLESFGIRKEILGTEHPDYASSLNNLASFYLDMGSFEIAERLYLQSIEIMRTSLGIDQPYYAEALQGLGGLYLHMQKYNKAEALYIESLDIWKKVYGTKNEDYLAFQANLADLYQKTQHFEKAEILFEEILKNQKQLPEKNLHLDAIALFNLGSFYLNTENYEKAGPLFEESKMIMENVLGKAHPKYSIVLNGLADIYEIKKRHQAAENLLIEASDLQNSRLNNAITYLSEKELTKYTKLFEIDLFRMMNFIQRRTQTQTHVGKLGNLCYNNVLFYKGYLLTAVQQLSALASSTEKTRELNIELKGYKRMLAKGYSTPRKDRDSVSMADLERKVNSIEKEMAKGIFSFEQTNKQINWQDVQTQLKSDEAAIEFIHFSSNTTKDGHQSYYGSLIVKAGFEAPLFIPLFEENKLLDILNAYSSLSSSSLNKMYARGGGVSPLEKIKLEGLYDLIWKPLITELKSIKTIYYSPSGLLHRISFDAIPTDNNQILSDQFQLVRLGSTRSIAFPENKAPGRGNEAMLYGGINYELESDADLEKLESMVVSDKAGNESDSIFDRGSLFENEKWTYLKGTDKEVADIEILLNANGFSTTIKTGGMATEESFKMMGRDQLSPFVIHIATHGYFYPDPKISAAKKNSDDSENLAFKSSDHPLIRSGLLLAGANHAWSAGQQQGSDKEDGVLTAYEISEMNLSNTELVVLSACETGLGDILGNEGVYGLQRALKIAGAKNLMISLWKVPDAETAKLMTSFYTYWLQDKLSIRKALMTAQKDFRNRGLDPYFWAGFILLE